MNRIRETLRTLAEGHLDSNAGGSIDEAIFDYEFVDSNDLYSDDDNCDVVSPDKENGNV